MFYIYGMGSEVPIDIREKAALPDDKREILNKTAFLSGIGGCFVLSTCNRTEFCLSCTEDADIKAVFSALFGGYEKYCHFYKGEEAIGYFFNIACGLESLIKRETQIITQISEAAQTAREAGCLSPELEVLIRTAVTTAKKACGIMTEDIRLSSSWLAVDWLEDKSGGLRGVKCLVVGNGKVGRLTARELLKRGADVTMTLRSRSDSVVPRGCAAIPYESRYEYSCDILISATKSPHFTFTEDRLRHYPRFIADLAVPRDISPALAAKYGGNYRCIDDFKTADEDLSRVYEIIEEGINEYYIWENYRNSLAAIDGIKDIIAKRLAAANTEEPCEIVARTADMIFGGLKEYITPENAEKCLKKIEARARL